MVTILDDDSAQTSPYGKLAFDAWGYFVSEQAGAVTLTISRTEGTEGTVSAHYYTQPSSAGGSRDYLETQGRIVFAPGETRKTIVLHALKDTQIEATESFYVILDSPSQEIGRKRKPFIPS